VTTPEQQAAEQRELSEETREARRLIELGLDAEAFMRSDLGRAIATRASRELEAAQEKLVDCDPFDVNAVRGLQMQAQVAQRVLTYFADLENEGRNAERLYRAAHDEAGG
jgi:hypothetical protein